MAALALHKVHGVPIHLPQLIRLLAVFALLGAHEAAAEESAALATAEARVGQGVAVGGGSGESTWRLSPLSLSAVASYAIRSDPWVSVFGGLTFEGNDRAAIGALIGLRLNPQAGPARVSMAAVAMGLPFSAYGATTGLGRCYGVSGGMGFCTDMEATVFALGSDIPDGRIATQAQFVLSMAFDVY